MKNSVTHHPSASQAHYQSESNLKNNAAGNYRAPIDPFAYNHICDNAASYEVKKRPVKKEQWQSVTDMSGRGFHPNQSTLTKGFVNSSRVAVNLDQNNRFFTDNLKIYETYGQLRRSQVQGEFRQTSQSSNQNQNFHQHIEQDNLQFGQENKSAVQFQSVGQQFYQKPTQEVIQEQQQTTTFVDQVQHQQQQLQTQTDFTQQQQLSSKSKPTQSHKKQSVILKQALNQKKRQGYTPKQYSKRPQTAQINKKAVGFSTYKLQNTSKQQDLQVQRNTVGLEISPQVQQQQPLNQMTFGRNDLETQNQINLDEAPAESTLTQADAQSIQQRNQESIDQNFNQIQTQFQNTHLTQNQQNQSKPMPEVVHSQSDKYRKRNLVETHGAQQDNSSKENWQSSYGSQYKSTSENVKTQSFKQQHWKAGITPYAIEL
eukprot:403377042